MKKNILLISDNQKDQRLFRNLLEAKGFIINRILTLAEIETNWANDDFVVVLVDYDCLGNQIFPVVEWLHQNKSKSSIILYGAQSKAGKISDLLQIGAYAFVPRTLLSKRIYGTILGGIKNREAFIEILNMMDDLREVNERQSREKKDLQRKNQELRFINRLSRMVAYDLTWESILPRIQNAGLQTVCQSTLLGMLYQIGAKWHLSLHFSEHALNKTVLERLQAEITEGFQSLCGKRFEPRELAIHLHSPNPTITSSPSSLSSKLKTFPIRHADQALGMMVIVPKHEAEFDDGKQELLYTITNILAMSLKNAQKHHRLKEMAVKDGLTRVLNHKGFKDLIQKEFQRAQRYQHPLSLIMIDVNAFKAINDSLGHPAGDYVLRNISECLQNVVRQPDIVARYGGDEFAILLPDTELPKAEMLVKRILATIKKHPFIWQSQRIKVEISCGISTSGEMTSDENEETLIQKADQRLYHAKRSHELRYSALS